jgi:hypothetical protein
MRRPRLFCTARAPNGIARISRTRAALRLPRAWLLWCACALLVAAPATPAVEGGDVEQRVKATFLYKFLDYVEWPQGVFEQPASPIQVGMLSAEPIAAALEQAAAQRGPQSRPLVVRRLRDGELPAGLHVVFVDKAHRERLGELLRGTQARPVLVVTESEGALAQGSVINFVLVEGKVRFEVSLETADRNRLKLSSRLLAVAHQIRNPTP